VANRVADVWNLDGALVWSNLLLLFVVLLAMRDTKAAGAFRMPWTEPEQRLEPINKSAIDILMM